MDTKNDIDLHDLETVEDNLSTEETRHHESDDDSLAAAGSAFMIG